MRDQSIVEVIASQVSVTIRGSHFQYAFIHTQQSYIERSAAQVKDKDILILLLLVV